MNRLAGDHLSAAVGPMPHTAARIMAFIRACEGIWLALAALATAVGPVSVRWLGPALAAFVLWTILFSAVALTRGLRTWLVTVDVAVTVLLCLANGWLVPLERISDGSGWVATVASLCVVGLPLAWRAWWSIPGGTLVVVAYAAGFAISDRPGLGQPHTAILSGQLAASVIVMALVRRASRTADVAFAAAHFARRAAEVDRARRHDEAAQLRLLHDTALTTLTLVGTGAIGQRRDRLAIRATADLEALQRMGTAADGPRQGRVQLDEMLTSTASNRADGLRVEVTVQACSVPQQVGDAFDGAVDEALRNVAGHARTTAAALTLVAFAGRVVVEVSDHGRGFNPGAPPGHHLGIRESIVGRMSAVDGHASVKSAPGIGTVWTLEWPRDGD